MEGAPLFQVPRLYISPPPLHLFPPPTVQHVVTKPRYYSISLDTMS